MFHLFLTYTVALVSLCFFLFFFLYFGLSLSLSLKHIVTLLHSVTAPCHHKQT